MKEVERISEQLDKAFNKEAWHGPALMELLADVDNKQAAAKPVKNVHSIWEVVIHITTWLIVARQRLEGEVVEPSTEEDWQNPKEYTEENWKNSVEWLIKNYSELKKAILLMDDSRLDESVPAKEYSNYVLLHGVIDHILYHAGQIALLKKMN